MYKIKENIFSTIQDLVSFHHFKPINLYYFKSVQGLFMREYSYLPNVITYYNSETGLLETYENGIFVSHKWSSVEEVLFRDLIIKQLIDKVDVN